MPKCEFSLPSIDGKTLLCRKGEALKQIIAQNDLTEIYSPAQLMEVICNHDDRQAREQCPAYRDLKQNGKRSSFSK